MSTESVIFLERTKLLEQVKVFPNVTSMMNSEPAPPEESCQHTMLFYLHPPGMTLKLPYILNWSCSELGLPPHPLHQTTRWFLLLMCTNNPICCGNKAIYKEVGWSAVDSSLLSWHKEEMPEDTFDCLVMPSQPCNSLYISFFYLAG